MVFACLQMIAHQRKVARSICVVGPDWNYSESQRALAWTILKQHGVA